MEDSLELPDDLEGINMQIMLSPEQLNHNSRENTPPHSLAYSNCTQHPIQQRMPKIKLAKFNWDPPLLSRPLIECLNSRQESIR